MNWRPALSLQTLKDQLDAAYPGWLFLGFLGDQAHAAVASDHNPNAQGVVCALDIGPGGGLDIFALANNIAANPHPDLKYVISNRRIAEWQYGFKWRPYSGSDPHDTHTHVSVGRGDDGQSVQPYDDTNKWNITGGTNDMATKEQLIELYKLAFPNQAVNGDWVAKFTGKDISDCLQALRDDPSRQAYITRIINDAAAYENSGAASTVLKPGKYEVK